MPEVFANLSYLGIVLGLVGTGMGLPLPEELFFIWGGVASYHGDMNPWLALGSCIMGALLGDCAVYWIGHHFGRGILRKKGWFTRLLHAEREQQVEQLIRRHGLKVLLGARFLPGIRAPVYLAAGVLRVPFLRFLAMDAICAALVTAVFFGLSYAFAQSILIWWEKIREAEIWAVAILAGVVAVVVLIWFVKRRRGQRQALAIACAEEAAKIENSNPAT